MSTYKGLILSIQVVTDDGIEMDDELAHTGDQGHLLEFASGHKALVEGANGRVETSRGEGCHV